MVKVGSVLASLPGVSSGSTPGVDGVFRKGGRDVARKFMWRSAPNNWNDRRKMDPVLSSNSKNSLVVYRYSFVFLFAVLRNFLSPPPSIKNVLDFGSFNSFLSKKMCSFRATVHPIDFFSVISFLRFKTWPVTDDSFESQNRLLVKRRESRCMRQNFSNYRFVFRDNEFNNYSCTRGELGCCRNQPVQWNGKFYPEVSLCEQFSFFFFHFPFSVIM